MKFLVPEDETVEVGTDLCVIGESAEGISGDTQSPSDQESSSVAQTQPQVAAQEMTQPTPPPVEEIAPPTIELAPAPVAVQTPPAPVVQVETPAVQTRLKLTQLLLLSKPELSDINAHILM